MFTLEELKLISSLANTARQQLDKQLQINDEVISLLSSIHHKSTNEISRL